jgi:hypothetical protein
MLQTRSGSSFDLGVPEERYLFLHLRRGLRLCWPNPRSHLVCSFPPDRTYQSLRLFRTGRCSFSGKKTQESDAAVVLHITNVPFVVNVKSRLQTVSMRCIEAES